MKAAFNEIHERAFGYHDVEQALEVVSVRLAAIARRGDGARGFQPVDGARGFQPSGIGKGRSVWFEAGDAPIECPVHQREGLAAGAGLDGPVVVQEYASTTLLFPGDRLRVTETGELLIHLRDA